MNPKMAIKLLLGLIVAVTLFHLAILIKLVPYDITWGGRLKNNAQMVVFETLSIALNCLLGFVLLLKGEYVKPVVPLKLVNLVLWAYLVLFSVNTLGNLVAKTTLEKCFALLTLAFSLLLWLILRKSKTGQTLTKTNRA
jgi:hypothetical protein